MTILVVVAHPDDEVLGCGGAVARLSKEKHDIYLAILGEGITSRCSQREQADKNLVTLLHRRSRKVAELLGLRDIRFFDLPDNRFDSVSLLDVIKLIEDLIDCYRPEVIYTHHNGDLNIDHVVTHRAVLTATRPQSSPKVKEIYTFEIPSSTEWAFGQFSLFQPNVFVDIYNTLEIKIEAMELYDSEARSFPHPRSPEALRSNARKWGSTVGLKAAEAFALIRMIR